MSGRYVALYDDQCEICQAAVSWIRLLDDDGSVEPLPIDPDRLGTIHPGLDVDQCLRQLHVVTPDDRVVAGWEAVLELGAALRPTRPLARLLRLGPLGRAGGRGYEWVAANRWEISKCRGGACRSANLTQTRRESPLRAFWTCWGLGLVLRLPLVLGATLRDQAHYAATWVRTRGRRLDLLDGRLSLCFLGGFPTDVVPIVFGESFMMIIYRGLAVDPGSPKMRASLERQAAGLPQRIGAVVATHHHEEHVGNLDWLARRVGVPVYTSERTAALLQPPARLPLARRAVIGQPPPLSPDVCILGDRLPLPDGGELAVHPSPGHSTDHVVLYDPEEKLLLAGDAFMGATFSTPNPDVDSKDWIATLERLLDLDIEIMVEGHGHVHTLRADVPDVPGVVERTHPREALEAKLETLRWVREQVEAGTAEGLPPRAIEATVFPWGRAWSWERFGGDALVRALSGGHFSRSEMIRSFLREPDDDRVLPDVLSVRLHRA